MRLFVAIASVIGTAAIFAVEADSNVVVATEKCAQTTPACMGVPVSDTAVSRELKAEVKEAVTAAAEAQYEKRYDDLVGAHDRFMSQLTISLWVITGLVCLLGVVVPIVGMALERRSTKAVVEREILKYQQALEDARKTIMDLKEAQAKSSMNLMKFVWVEFLHVITAGGYDNSDRDHDIAHPIYRIVEALVFAYKLGDDKVLKECVSNVAKIVGLYEDVIKDKKDLDNVFKEYVKDHGICADSFDFYDLAMSMGKSATQEKVVKFLNEFGIKMFGEKS